MTGTVSLGFALDDEKPETPRRGRVMSRLTAGDPKGSGLVSRRAQTARSMLAVG